MGRKYPEFINGFRDRHGKMRFYFRRGLISLAVPSPGTPEFSEAYGKLLAECEPNRTRRIAAPGKGTMTWVIAQYMASDRYQRLKPATKEVYGRIFDWLRDKCGDYLLTTLREQHVRHIRNELKDRPSVADYTVDKVGMLWGFAKEHLEMNLGPNPAAEVASIHTEHESHKAWPAELCEKFEALPHPRLVLAYDLMRYTGQRRSDIVQMTWKRFDGKAIELVQEKTGTYVWLPCHPTLAKKLARVERTAPYILTTERGRPFKAGSVTQMMGLCCKELGYPGYSPHGLRHLAGSELAEAGCSMHEVMSILGHLTEREAAGYVKQAQRKRMAQSGMDKWAGHGGV